jgi:hypothetical protein
MSLQRSKPPSRIPLSQVVELRAVKRRKRRAPLIADQPRRAYRRISFCDALGSPRAFELLDTLPIANRRYGRLQICATNPRRVMWLTPNILG